MFKSAVAVVALALFIAGVQSYVAETAEVGSQDAHNVHIRDVSGDDSQQDSAPADTSASAPGGNGFHGFALSSFYSSTNDNGKVSERHGGEELINDNGRITRRFFQ